MKARYAGFCQICQSDYPVGTDITKHARGYVHLSCAQQGQPAGGYRLSWTGKQLRVQMDWSWPPRAAVHQAVKGLIGRKWLMTAKAWDIVPTNTYKLADLISGVAPDMAQALREDPALAPAREAADAARQQAQNSRRASLDATVELPCPEGLSYLPFQQAGIAAASKLERILFGDEMGLGKTVEAIGVINATGARKVVVVCPASLRLNWKRELERWLVRDLTVGVVETKGLPETDVVVVNYERIGKNLAALQAFDADVLVLDEAHYCKNPKAQRTKNILGYWSKKDSAFIPGIPARRTIMLTGTPIPNRPIELWPIVKALDPEGLGRSWKLFATRYCGAHQTRYGWEVQGASNLDELQDRLRQSCMIRRLKRDVLSELPEKRRQIVLLPQNGSKRVVKAEQKAMAKDQDALEDAQTVAELMKAADDDEAYETAVNHLRALHRVAFERISSLRHDTALAKVDAVVEHVERVLEGEKKVVIMAHHKDVVAAITAGLAQYGVAVITGETPIDGRQSAVDAFQNDADVRVFIGTIGAAGVGITLTAAATVVFAELDWVPGNMSQAEDRCHRIGQTGSVLVQHLVLDGSIDANLASVLIEKQAVQDQALDTITDGLADSDASERAMLEAMASEAATNNLTRAVIKNAAINYTEAQVRAIHKGLQLLAGTCDGALRRDDVGYNALDTRIGKSLASSPSLTAKQAVLGKKILKKYSRTQLPEELTTTIWPPKEVE